MIVDAGVILSAFLPDERQAQAQALIRDHVARRVRLAAPTLLLYEVTNAVVQAIRRGRITSDQGQAILTTFQNLDIALELVPWRRILSMAERFERSAYDAAYLALGEESNEPMITGDLRLYRAVHDQLPWVQWIGDYPTG